MTATAEWARVWAMVVGVGGLVFVACVIVWLLKGRGE